ncbi:MAG: hypothetical protein BGO78_07485 [Chloroflexi bacterium 44-23]|nr:MAG: hypothetical protein BGO78_07485 [Chloroflexi bacterium 44-23]
MRISDFETEHFFAKYEFSTPFQLCNSDCETISIAELLTMADVPMKNFGELSLGYTQSLGHPELREKIAGSYENVTAEDVIMLASPVEGIYLAARAVLEPADEVIVLTPAYDALVNVIEHIVGRANVHRWNFIAGKHQWELDIGQLKKLIHLKTKLIVVNFPHNPTGFLPSQAQMDQLAEIVEQNNLLLFCDEIYFGLVHSGTKPIKSAAEMTKRSIVLNGLSKTYGLPGLRTGWLVIRDRELRENIINWKSYTSICASAPSEFLAMAAWSVRQQLRDRSIALIEHNLNLADAFFQRWPQLFYWRRPMASSIALVRMDVPSVQAYATELAERAGILILPAISLGSDDQHMRMGFGRAAFGEALQQFEQYLHTQFN